VEAAPFKIKRLMIMTARVLVVEDDVTMAEVLKAYLTRAGYQVEWSVYASSMAVYGEGRCRCAEHGSVRPPARRRDDLDAGAPIRYARPALKI
jgi:hypothetical protein